VGAAFRISVPRAADSIQPVEREPGEQPNIFERVRKEVDLWKVLPPEGHYKEFDGYYLRSCISPDHDDTQLSMLVFHDGVKCQACGLRADTTDVYTMFHPEMGKFQTACALLDGDYKTDGDAVAKPKVVRNLDPDLALKAHLELAGHPDRVEQLEKVFGFTRAAIRHFRLGWARVMVPILPHEYDRVEGAPDIEWREREGQEPSPYQWQWRFSVPVFDGGKDHLRQRIQRKANEADLGAKVQLEHKAGTNWLFNGNVLDDTDMVVMVEGWGNTVALWQAGIPAVGGISGAGQFKAEWAERLGRIKRLYVAGDQDAAGQGMNARIKKHIPWARIVELPDMHRGGDIRDLWLAGWRRREFLRLLKRADMETSWNVIRRGR
jgi:hypothetical protein